MTDRRRRPVVGRVGDTDEARSVVLELEHAGVGSDAISLIASDSDAESPPRGVLTHMVTGSLLGVAVLGPLGLLFGLVPGVDVAPGWLFLFGALVGSTVGALIGAAWGTGTSPAWLEAFSARDDGPLAVRVAPASPEDVHTTRSVFDRMGVAVVDPGDPETRRAS
jgi:hypothetical protein